MTGRTLLALAVLALVPAAAGAQELGPEELVGPPHLPHRGTTVSALGGVDGYTGQLATFVEPGPGWGLLVNVQPINEAAVELLYSGAWHALRGSGQSDGRLLRSGVGANLKFTLSPTMVEPYLFAGLGFDWARLSGVASGAGWATTDLFGSVAFGAGLKLHLGGFTAGLRGGIDLLFGEEFAPSATGEGDLWNGRLELGATF